MKRFLAITIMLFAVVALNAKEATLFSADTDASFEEWSYSDNLKGKSRSGNIRDKDIFKMSKKDGYIRFYVEGIPNKTFNYEILAAYPSFLNEPNTSAGYIDNVGDIKSIKITAVLNRPYDEVYLLYSTSKNGEIKKILFKKPFSEVKSMEEAEFIFENPSYDSDVRNRDIKSDPLVGSFEDGLYFRGIGIKCNEVHSTYEPSDISIVYLKSIDVIYDLKFSEEQYATRKELNDEFGIDKQTEAQKEKVRNKLRFENNYYKEQESKKATENTNSNNDAE